MTTKKIEAKDYITAMNVSAERLSDVRRLINGREEAFKTETNGLYAEEKSLKEDLLAALKTIGLSSVKTASGDSYLISKKHRFAVKDALALDKYARDERCVTIDKKALNQRFTEAFKKGTLPDFVTPEPYETISIRGAKKEGEEESASDSP